MGPPDTWHRMAHWLRQVPSLLAEPPKAIVVISGHWEADPVAVNVQAAPPLLYDYFGFPAETYELKYPAPGDPVLAMRIKDLLKTAGFAAVEDRERGLDHGVFIPFKLIYPNADMPIVQLSLRTGLRAEEHLRMGRALMPLREEGVLLVGSGMSYHNLRSFGPGAAAASDQFDGWLTETVCAPKAAVRERALAEWQGAPGGRQAHPREEHLLPLMVAAGAAGNDQGKKLFQDRVLGATVSAFGFGM